MPHSLDVFSPPNWKDATQRREMDAISRSFKDVTRRVTAGCGSGVPWASRKMTRRLPEGRWDLRKIPRISILMSQDDLLVGAGSVTFTQVEGQIGGTRLVRKIQLDERHRSADSRGPRNFSVS